MEEPAGVEERIIRVDRVEVNNKLQAELSRHQFKEEEDK